MKKTLMLILMMGVIDLPAQRLTTILNLNTPAFGIINYEQQYYSPNNMPHVFFTGEPGGEKRNFSVSYINMKYHWRAGVGIGLHLKADYKRFALRGGIQLCYQYTTIKLRKLYDSEVDEYPILFSVNSLQTSFPLMASVDLKRKNNAPFVIAGVEPGFYSLLTEFTDEYAYRKEQLNYLYGIFWNEKAWLNLNIGYGRRYKAFELYVIYKKRIDSNDDALSIKSSLTEVHLNFLLGHSKLSTKHYLYRENN